MRRKIIPYNPILVPLAAELRKNITLAEVLLWKELHQKKMLGFDFDRQKPIHNHILDFYCKDLMLAIEIDGGSHDGRKTEDDRRQKELEDLGVSFLRFEDRMVKNDIKNVLYVIQNWIEERVGKVL